MLNPDQRRTIRQAAWSPQVRWYTILILVGLAMVAAGTFSLLLLFPKSSPALSPFPWTQLIAVMVVSFAGAILFGVASIARSRRLMRLLFRPCPQCRTQNPANAQFCSHCGAPFEAT